MGREHETVSAQGQRAPQVQPRREVRACMLRERRKRDNMLRARKRDHRLRQTSAASPATSGGACFRVSLRPCFRACILREARGRRQVTSPHTKGLKPVPGGSRAGGEHEALSSQGQRASQVQPRWEVGCRVQGAGCKSLVVCLLACFLASVRACLRAEREAFVCPEPSLLRANERRKSSLVGRCFFFFFFITLEPGVV